MNQPITYTHILKYAQSGDLLIYDTYSKWGQVVKYASNSNYTHVAIIIRDPYWLNECIPRECTRDWTGLYILHASPSLLDRPSLDTGKVTFGVQVNKFSDIEIENRLGSILYYREMHQDIDHTVLKRLYTTHSTLPYDKYFHCWLYQYMFQQTIDHKINCSILVAKLLEYIGWTNPTHYTLSKPSDYILDNPSINSIYNGIRRVVF